MPHISYLYSSIGFINLLNKSICISYCKDSLLMFSNNANTALFACLAIYFFAEATDPLWLVYTYVFVVSLRKHTYTNILKNLNTKKMKIFR